MPRPRSSIPRKVQATIGGYTAWVVEQLGRVKGVTMSEAVRYILERWIDDNPEMLRSMGITRDQFVERFKKVDFFESGEEEDEEER